MARLLFRHIVFVSVKRFRNDDGRMRCGRHPSFDLRRTRDRAHTTRMIAREIMIAFGGPIAESVACRRRTLEGAEIDSEMIECLLDSLTSDAKTKLAWGRGLAQQTGELIHQNWAAVEALAGELDARKRLSGRDVSAILRQFGIR